PPSPLYTLSLHDALPISRGVTHGRDRRAGAVRSPGGPRGDHCADAVRPPRLRPRPEVPAPRRARRDRRTSREVVDEWSDPICERPEVNEEIPGTAVRVTPSRQRADEWAVVLAAAGTPHWLRRRLDGWALIVPPDD